jgi:diacylglycerol O-acyltransferase
LNAERLSAQDAVFLELEDSGTPMHIGAKLVFEGSPLRDETGALDIGRLRAHLLARLHRFPKVRKRVTRLPLLGRAVWVDDEHFRLERHVRHVTLPREADVGAQRELEAEFYSRRLDRERPLWEILAVDGLPDDRMALLCKLHHAFADGLAGVEFMALLLAPEPSDQPGTPRRWRAGEPPGLQDLLRDEASRRIEFARSTAEAASKALRNPAGTLDDARKYATGLFHTVSGIVNPSSELPINGRSGPNRALETFRIPLEEIRAIKQSLGGTINELVLSMVAGGLRGFLLGHGTSLDGLSVRAMMPVSTRSDVDRGSLGNKIAVVVAALPVALQTARARHHVVRKGTIALQDSQQALGTDVVTWLAEWTIPRVMTELLQLSLRMRSSNLMITNIHGPDETLYLLNAPLLEIYPVAELWSGQGLSVAVLSYAGFLHVGVNADPNIVSDPESFAASLRDEFQDLRKLAS